jgi:hypothetical protein
MGSAPAQAVYKYSVAWASVPATCNPKLQHGGQGRPPYQELAQIHGKAGCVMQPSLRIGFT